MERFGKLAVKVRWILGEAALLVAMMLAASCFYSVR
jgi:hypothetical protein